MLEPSPGDDDLGLRPLSARSVLLSFMLGTHPPLLPARTLVRIGDIFGIAEGTVRVALSRMATDGDVTAKDGRYRLSDRLIARQRHQDEGQAPSTRPWDGGWRLIVVDPAGAERTNLERILVLRRYRQWYEGLWLRPDNLNRPPRPVQGGYHALDAHPEEDPVTLVGQLWDLEAWSGRAARLLDAFGRAPDPAGRFVVSAALLRHLGTDPLLPDELLPSDWPGPDLRLAYDHFTTELRELLRAEMSGVDGS